MDVPICERPHTHRCPYCRSVFVCVNPYCPPTQHALCKSCYTGAALLPPAEGRTFYEPKRRLPSEEQE